MHVSMVHLHIKPEFLAEFREAVRLNHEASTREPGNRRFDVLQSVEDPTRFVLYEVYESAEAAAAHRETPHFKAWREKVEAWYASPRVAVPYVALHPSPNTA